MCKSVITFDVMNLQEEYEDMRVTYYHWRIFKLHVEK
jgi:hypothetical protein